MERFIHIAYLALPILSGGAALAARVLHGGARPWLATSLVVLGGVLLGWAAALMLDSTAHLVGHGQDDEEAPDVDRQIEQALARRLEGEEQK